MKMSKANPELGKQVHEHLLSLGLETPMIEQKLSKQEQIDVIAASTRTMLEALGLDLTDDSLIDTPNRVGKMWVNDFMWGLDYDNFPKCTTVDNKMSAPDEFVNIACSAVSQCEHHLLSIIPAGGLNKPAVVVAYIPNERVLGLSKVSRVVSFFSARPQVQERLTHQILEAIKFITKSPDVAVFASMAHLCMSTRGAKDTAADTVTCAMSGKFVNNPYVRQEFLAIARDKLAT
jgi:GTP cyclohydrolase IA